MNNSLKQVREQVVQTRGREVHKNGREGVRQEHTWVLEAPQGQRGQGRANGHGTANDRAVTTEWGCQDTGISDWAYLGNPE